MFKLKYKMCNWNDKINQFKAFYYIIKDEILPVVKAYNKI